MRAALEATSRAYQGVGDFEGTGENMAGVIDQVRAALETGGGDAVLARVERAEKSVAALDAILFPLDDRTDDEKAEMRDQLNQRPGGVRRASWVGWYSGGERLLHRKRAHEPV